MRIQAYTAYNFTLTVTVASIRPQEAPSTLFTAAKIQEDIAAQVRVLLEEHKHVGETAIAYPAAQRIQTYFPTATIGGVAKPLFALRELMPAGSPRDIDMDWHLEIMRIRYAGFLNLLPPCWAATAAVREAKERVIEYACQQLLSTNAQLNLFIPGDDGLRPGEGTTIDIVCELGAASARQGVDIPDPLSP